MAGRVAGKVALITGAAIGLGLADAQMLAEEGATVILTDIDAAAGSAAAAQIGASASFMRHDVASEADWAAVMAAVAERHGRLDILVNNAGIVIPGTIEDATLETLRRHLAVHVEACFLGCKAAIPLMAAGGGGSIINMASTSALLGYAAFFAYGAAKGAIRSMSRSIAMHCEQQGYRIRCNTVFPSGIETPMIQAVAGRPGQPVAVPAGVLPPNALGDARDVAAMILFLASDESRFVNGAEFVIDNGTVIRSGS
jgi:3(or 17)beta-hydroxysteroid dehydrogenase